eukprot:CAMPEP_0170542320 /NCGR_PEP_ID=MMETSP0211-20121228/1785_1 /TAXON_ID=311385 /ORGANISM="Pseudokeronopsis sp., Strain OXSARD2" /LENGTH=55 /DNA_ID=CAMNT_0010845341 /DNA_START=783 /DNA_END=950 /DNA_ORIENTATION=-
MVKINKKIEGINTELKKKFKQFDEDLGLFKGKVEKLYEQDRKRFNQIKKGEQAMI